MSGKRSTAAKASAALRRAQLVAKESTKELDPIAQKKKDLEEIFACLGYCGLCIIDTRR
jgi:hypothetical protein